MTSPRQGELVTGPFRPTLEAALEQQLRRAKTDDPGAPVVVLVGSNVLALDLRRRLAERLPLWDVRFLTFRELAAALGAERMRARGRRPLPPLGESQLVAKVIREGVTGYFDPVANLPGFARTTASSIKDLKEAGIGPQLLTRLPGAKLGAFRGFFDGYQAALEAAGFYDEADLYVEAAEHAEDVEWVAGAAFITYGFYDLTGLQRRLVQVLGGRARSSAALVPAEPGAAFEYCEPLIEWFIAAGYARSASSSAETLAGRLFGPATGKPAATHEVRVLSAPGEPREAREVVRQIVELAGQGVAFDEIGVLLRHGDAYSRVLRDALERCGVPYFMSGGVPLSETRSARALMMLADLLAGELPRAQVMQFVHFAPLDFEALIGHTPSTSDWERLSIEAGVVEGLDGWSHGLGRLADRCHAADEDDAPSRPADELPHLRAFIGRLVEAKRALADAATWTDRVGRLTETYERWTEPGDERDRVCAEVRRLAELDALGATATSEDVRAAVSELLDQSSLSPAGFQRGRVFIGDLFRARGLGFRAVIVPGMVEKGFPAQGRQDPILLDSERSRLAKAAGPAAFLPLKGGRVAEERTLFALAVSAADERTTLTFPRLDVASGRERVPSHFLTGLFEALTGQRSAPGALESSSFFTRVSMFRAGGGGTDVDLAEFDLHTVVRLVESGKARQALFLADESASFKRGIEVETARWQEGRFTAFDGLAGAGRTLAGEVMAPTRIETYAGCPFIYFLRHVLKVDVLEEPERLERITPLERGALLHRVFRRAYARCFAGDGEVSGDALAAALREAAEAEFGRRGAMGPGLTWALDRAEMIRDLERFAALDTAERAELGARPARFEMRFGMPSRGGEEDEASTEQPLALEVGGKIYRFKGKVDRIDFIGATGARVIDYKTGAATAKPDAFAGGAALQLPIYLLAVDMLAVGREVAEAAYAYATGRGGFRSVAFSRAALDTRRAELDQIITTVESCIEAGLFVATFDAKRCRSCDFRDACGPNCDLLFGRKMSDPRVAALLALRDIG